jgi:DinB superfamily
MSLRRFSSPVNTGTHKKEPSVALAAWTLRLIAEFDAADQKAQELVTGLSPEQLNWQPGPGAWSVGQCLEHLCIANEVYLPAISSSLEGKPISAAQEIRLGWLSRWFVNSYIEPSPQSLLFWIAFYAVTKRHASSFDTLAITM